MKACSALLSFAFLLAACQPATDVNEIVGQLESDRIELTAEFGEPITVRPVAEGQPVQATDILVQQDESRARIRLLEAEATIGQFQARLDELIEGPRREQIDAVQASLDGARRDLAFRNTELDRAQSLLDRNLASPNARDAAKAALDQAQARVEIDEARLSELLTGTRIEELQQARAALLQAESVRDRLAIDVERHATRAPVDGILDSLIMEPGERPMPGQAIAIMLAGEQPYARVYIPEALRLSALPGTAVRVSVDGLDRPINGHVRWVASEAMFTPYFALTEHDRGRLSYVAKIDLEWNGDRLPDGLPVQVSLNR